MKLLSLLVSPRAKSAFFNDYIAACQAELSAVLHKENSSEVAYRSVGGLDLFDLAAPVDQLQTLSRLSFVQGIFERQGELLLPLDISPEFALHEDFVFGAKFKGKTNETLTQMLINVGLGHLEQYTSNGKPLSELKLLDPMCGRATTLLWAMRYGITSRGIEQDSKALADVRQNVKKWCKVHRQKHQLTEGFVGGKSAKKNKNSTAGKFIDLAAENSAMRVVIGDGAKSDQLLSKEKFDLLVTDIPYGVQHFTTEKTRNPLEVLKACAPAWKASLRPGGVMVIAFNKYIPKRAELISAFEAEGLETQDFSAPHRMSESIVRDVVVFKKPAR